MSTKNYLLLSFPAPGHHLAVIPSRNIKSHSEDIHPTLGENGERSSGSAPRFLTIVLSPGT